MSTSIPDRDGHDSAALYSRDRKLALKDAPQRVRDLRFDYRRNVPIPYMNILPDDSVNFLGISLPRVQECAAEGLCGICGKALDYWIAFLGGPLSFANRTYSDPPFHRDCVEVALRLCPHIAMKRHKRASDERLGEHWKSPDATLEKPDQWIVALTREYKVIVQGHGILFRAGTIKHHFTYEYNEEGNLVSADASTE